MKLGARAMLALAALRAGSVPAFVQVQMIIPWPAGGGTDIIGHLNQPAFTEATGTQVVIRNVGGATGTIGTAEVVRAKPDGRTLRLTSIRRIDQGQPSADNRSLGFLDARAVNKRDRCTSNNSLPAKGFLGETSLNSAGG